MALVAPVPYSTPRMRAVSSSVFLRSSASDPVRPVAAIIRAVADSKAAADSVAVRLTSSRAPTTFLLNSAAMIPPATLLMSLKLDETFFSMSLRVAPVSSLRRTFPVMIGASASFDPPAQFIPEIGLYTPRGVPYRRQQVWLRPLSARAMFRILRIVDHPPRNLSSNAPCE